MLFGDSGTGEQQQSSSSADVQPFILDVKQLKSSLLNNTEDQVIYVSILNTSSTTIRPNTLANMTSIVVMESAGNKAGHLVTGMIILGLQSLFDAFAGRQDYKDVGFLKGVKSHVPKTSAVTETNKPSQWDSHVTLRAWNPTSIQALVWMLS